MHPYGRYLLTEQEMSNIAEKITHVLKGMDTEITNTKEKNEGHGVQIIAVNMTVMDWIRNPHRSGQIEMFFKGYPLTTPSYQNLDVGSQRIGVEFYLWPTEGHIIMEIFVLPYMNFLDREEINLPFVKEGDELTDWYACERMWRDMLPLLKAEIQMESLLVY